MEVVTILLQVLVVQVAEVVIIGISDAHEAILYDCRCGSDAGKGSGLHEGAARQ